MTVAGGGGIIRNDFPAEAGESLADKEYHALTVADGDREVELADATSEVLVGVLVSMASTGAVGEQVRVAGPGDICPVKCGGTVTRGTRVMIDAADEGKILNATGTVQVLGTALESGSDGDLVLVQINPSSIDA